jgi:hypothetical protein
MCVEEPLRDGHGRAAEAAHSSERVAAPVACWIGARSGRSLTEPLEIAGRIGGA